MIRIMKYFLFLVLAVMVSFPGSALDINDNWKLLVTNELELIRNDRWGAGQSNSFIYMGNKGWSYEDRFDFLNRITTPSAVYEVDVDMRFTNNERIDNEDASLKKLYFKRNSPYTLFRVGDFFANFSQYSLNQNLKGASFSIKESPTNPWDVNLLWGAYKSRWEYTWNDESDELKNTFFSGMRTGRKIGPFELHLNYVFTNERRLDDITANSSRSTAELVHNHLGSLDWRFRPTGRFNIEGESAIARNHSTTTGNIDVGYAHKIRGRFRNKGLRSQMEYERTPSDFNTPGGSASSDRERYRIRNNYYLGENDIFCHYTAYWDNIQNTQTTTTKVKMPEAGISLRNLFKRKTLSSTFRLRQRRRHQSDNSQDQRTDTLNLSLEDKFGPFRPALEYEFRRVNPRKDTADSGEKTHAVSLRVNSYYRTDKLTLRPSVSLRHEQTKDFGAPASRGLNKDWLWSGGLSGSYNKELNFNIGYNFSEADNYAIDSNSRRRVFRCSFDYNMDGNRDNVLRLEYQDRRNSFSTNTNDYNENIWKFRWIRRF